MSASGTAPPDPASVWDLIVRADELMKYASNRDAATAYAQAREVLDGASRAAAALRDRSIAERFATQIATRLDDIARREGDAGGEG